MSQPAQRPLSAESTTRLAPVSEETRPAFPTLVYRLLDGALSRDPVGQRPLTQLSLEQAEPSLLPTLGALEQRGLPVTPESLRPWTRESHLHTTARNLQSFATFEALTLKLEQARLPWAALKGLDLLVRLYPDVGWRAMSDFDILVRPADLDLVDALMTKAGFEQHAKGTTAMQPARIYRAQGLFVDVHVRLGRGAVPLPDADRLLSCTILLEVEDCPIRMLTRSDAYLSLALLMAKDTFSPRHLDALRLAELALVSDRLTTRERCDLQVESRRKHWHKALRRAGEITDWVQGGLRPIWSDPGLGCPGTRNAVELSRWQILARTAAMRDTAMDSLRYVAAEAAISAARILSGRRLGIL